MGKECEVDILDIDKGEAAARLRKLGAKYNGHRQYRRVEFLIGKKMKGKHTWARVRTDGKSSTMTVKTFRGTHLPMEEHEIVVGDFEEAIRMTRRMTTSKMLYFENERDSYELGKATITLDKWPSIPHFMEIEGPSMAYVKEMHKRLDITGEFVGNATLDSVYKRYGLNFRKVVAKNNKKLKEILG